MMYKIKPDCYKTTIEPYIGLQNRHEDGRGKFKKTLLIIRK